MWIECLFCLKCFDKLFVLILILFMKIKYINKLIRGFIGMLELFLFLIKCKDEWNILKFFFCLKLGIKGSLFIVWIIDMVWFIDK